MNPLEKARINPKSIRAAINAKCWDCNYDEYDSGNWRDQVTACPSSDCPLFPHRPLNSKAKASIKEAKLTAMSEDERKEYDIAAKLAGDKLRKSLHKVIP